MKQATPLNSEIRNCINSLLDEGRIESQEDISRLTGYGKSTISEIVNDKKKASRKFCTKFEQVFNVSLKDFVVATDHRRAAGKVQMQVFSVTMMTELLGFAKAQDKTIRKMATNMSNLEKRVASLENTLAVAIKNLKKK